MEPMLAVGAVRYPMPAISPELNVQFAITLALGKLRHFCSTSTIAPTELEPLPAQDGSERSDGHLVVLTVVAGVGMLNPV